MATVRSISVQLRAEVANYIQGLTRARAATSDLVNELSKSEQQRANFEKLGHTLAIAGAGMAAGIGLAAKAAIDWESAWAGVEKTVDGTETQLAALEEELRAMARELPATHAEIAAVAEAAGQLGVATEDVTRFTRVMIALGETTNLTADEAATSIAQLMNVMGTAPEDVDRLAAALVELGNNGASTEREILEMAQRIAGAGAVVGASEADVLALANALASAGINAEAGGSSISRVLIEISTAVASGSEKVQGFAKVAGMSAEDFANAFRRDPVEATNAFIIGLGRMNQAGQDVFTTLADLGFSEILVRDALLRLASAGDLLTQSLEDGSEAWQANVALQEEAEKRYQTTAARIQVAQNQLNDFAIEMGAVFLPIIAEGAEAIGNFVEWLAGLPDPVQNIISILGVGAAAMALLGGTALIAVPKIAAYKAALAELNVAGGTTATVAGRVSRGMRQTVLWAGRAAAVFAALQIAAVAVDAAIGNDLNPQVDALGEGLSRWAKDGQVAGESARLLGDNMEKLDTAFRSFNSSGFEQGLASAIEWISGTGGLDDSMTKARERIDAVDQALAQLVQAGRGEDAALVFERLAAMAALHGHSTEDLLRLLPAYAAALEVSGANAEAAAGQTSHLADALGLSGKTAAEFAKELDNLDKELKTLFDRVFGLQNAQDDLADAFDALTEQIKAQQEAGDKNAGALTGMSEAARDNRDAAQELLEAYGQLILETIRTSGSQEDAEKATADFEKQLDKLEEQTGVNVRELEGYNEVVSEIDRLIEITFETSGVQGAIEAIDRIKRRQDDIQRQITMSFQVEGYIPQGGAKIPNRHGGVYVHAQDGLLREAQVFSPVAPARYAFAEPATGGEAFIPRFGDRDRSLAIADAAAQWHGGRVVDMLGGPFQWRGQRPSVTGGDGAASSTVNTTYNVFPQRADFTVRDLETLQRVQDTRARVGRPG